MALPTDQTKLLPLESFAPKPAEKKTKMVWIWSLTIVALIIATITIALIWSLLTRDSSKPGMIGLWPTYGGGLLNQQISPNPLNIKFNNENIKHISINCTYESPDGIGFTGYPTIDNNNNTYFTDFNGYITSINLDTCNINWKQHVGNLLGYGPDTYIITAQTLTIFQDSNNNKGLLFAIPTFFRWKQMTDYTPNSGCYAIAIHLNNGTFWWKVELGEPNNKHNTQCVSHGFYVDGKYAFGGMSQGGSYNLENGSKFIGRYFRIDIDQHKILNIWYPFNINLTNNIDEYNMSYSGIGIYNYPTIINDYIIFGTANLMRIPYIIAQCLVANSSDNFNNYLLLNKSNHIDMCGNNKSDNNYYRCLEKDMYPSSLIILNKNTFKLEIGIVLQGLDIHYPGCRDSAENKYCAGWQIENKPGIGGFNADLIAVTAYKNKQNNKLYVAASNKPGRLHLTRKFGKLYLTRKFGPSGKLYLTRKFGPWTHMAQFNMAVSEDNMIGITSINGQNTASYNLSNDIIVCDGTASIHAFDLNTGNTLWIVINPYGKINHPMCFDDNDYFDYTLSTTCEYGNFTNNNNNIPIHILPKSIYEPFQSEERAKFYAPVTIVKDMVFIPSQTGDVWIVNLFDGSFIHHIICPNTTYVNNTYNRPGIKGGISVVNDRIVFYCGSYMNTPSHGNTLVSIQL